MLDKGGALIVFSFLILSFIELVAETHPLHIERVLMKPVEDPHDIICIEDGRSVFIQFVNITRVTFIVRNY